MDVDAIFLRPYSYEGVAGSRGWRWVVYESDLSGFIRPVAIIVDGVSSTSHGAHKSYHRMTHIL